MRLSKYGIILGLGLAAAGGINAQSVPNAPDVPDCSMKDGKSDCRFKEQMSGTPTSVVGNRVILFNRSATGGHGTSRNYIAAALQRLATKYGFTATVTENPSIFTNANLANTKVVIMSNGDGDVVPGGANRNALENFQQVNGWGVIWIHAACAFITSGWPFGQQSCVQQYFHHNSAGTPRRVFIDSGTTASPNHGIKNPQTEFMLRNLPGYSNNRTISMPDEYYCFRAPARNTQGVNVLLGYDRSSGVAVNGCPDANSTSVTASQNHNLAWSRFMGKGITIYNSIGHDEATYTSNSGAGDSLLWRFIRYAAKDWEKTPPVSFIAEAKKKVLDHSTTSGTLAISFIHSGRNAVLVSDVSGKRVFAKTFDGVERAEIPNLKRGIYYVKVASPKGNEVKQVRIL